MKAAGCQEGARLHMAPMPGGVRAEAQRGAAPMAAGHVRDSECGEGLRANACLIGARLDQGVSVTDRGRRRR